MFFSNSVSADSMDSQSDPSVHIQDQSHSVTGAVKEDESTNKLEIHHFPTTDDKASQSTTPETREPEEPEEKIFLDKEERGVDRRLELPNTLSNPTISDSDVRHRTLSLIWLGLNPNPSLVVLYDPRQEEEDRLQEVIMVFTVRW
jgi:hypothetical protein